MEGFLSNIVLSASLVLVLSGVVRTGRVLLPLTLAVNRLSTVVADACLVTVWEWARISVVQRFSDDSNIGALLTDSIGDDTRAISRVHDIISELSKIVIVVGWGIIQ